MVHKLARNIHSLLLWHSAECNWSSCLEHPYICFFTLDLSCSECRVFKFLIIVSSHPQSFFKDFLKKFYLKGRVRETELELERKTVHLQMSATTKVGPGWSQQPELHLSLPHGGKDPLYWALFCCFLWCISWELRRSKAARIQTSPLIWDAGVSSITGLTRYTTMLAPPCNHLVWVLF